MQSSRRFRFFVTLWSALVLTAVMGTIPLESRAQASGIRYAHYANARYGYSIDYPAFLSPAKAPTNDDGRSFRSRDALSVLSVFGFNNIDEKSAQDLYRACLAEKGRAVAYKALGSNWFVVSWTAGGQITYQKTYVGPGSGSTFIVTYPASQRSLFNPIVARLAGSFRPGDLGTPH